MTVFDGARDQELAPLWADILGAVVWFACIAGWVVILIGVAVAMGAV